MFRGRPNNLSLVSFSSDSFWMREEGGGWGRLPTGRVSPTHDNYHHHHLVYVCVCEKGVHSKDRGSLRRVCVCVCVCLWVPSAKRAANFSCRRQVSGTFVCIMNRIGLGRKEERPRQQSKLRLIIIKHYLVIVLLGLLSFLLPLILRLGNNKEKKKKVCG